MQIALRRDTTRFINVFSSVILSAVTAGARRVTLSATVEGPQYDPFAPEPPGLPEGFRVLKIHADDMRLARSDHASECPSAREHSSSVAGAVIRRHKTFVRWPRRRQSTSAAAQEKWAPCGCSWAVLTALDDGPGREDVSVDNLFKPFEYLRLGDMHDGLATGSALSFVILRRVVADHGGTLWLASQPAGQGNMLVCVLPMRRVVIVPSPGDRSSPDISNSHIVSGGGRVRSLTVITDPETVPHIAATPGTSAALDIELAPAAEAGVAASARRCVLIVDDVRSVRTLLKRSVAALLGGDYDIFEAADGREAVSKAMALQPAFILMDRRMPVMEGDEATRELRARGYTRPIFGVTGDALPVDVCTFRDAGATDVLVKPVTRASLALVLREYLALPPPANPAVPQQLEEVPSVNVPFVS
jgi:CheY-like chemotaxis protein